MKTPALIDNTYKLLEDGNVEFFCSMSGTPHITLLQEDALHTYATDSTEFTNWLREFLHSRIGIIPGPKQLKDVCDAVGGKAMIAKKFYAIYVRNGKDDGKAFIDLGDVDRKVILIDSDGYQVLDRPPQNLKFVRSPGMLPLPMPQSGGSLEMLRKLIGFEVGYRWYLLLAWIVAAMLPNGPYTILILSGPPGAAKTTLADLLRRLIDPSAAPLRGSPTNERDLFIAAVRSWLQAYDNLSGLREGISDAICRLSNTNGALVLRKLYTDTQEQILTACRPQLFTGINDPSYRSDFTDRSIQIALDRISEEKRKPLEDLNAEIEEALPQIYGALLDLVSATLRELPEVRLTKLPRMADFAKIAKAVEAALKLPDDTILDAYEQMRISSDEAILDASPVTAEVMLLAEKGWQGSASNLYETITSRIEDGNWRKKSMPGSPSHLSGHLRRLIPAFQSRGILVDCDGQTPGSRSKRFITIRKAQGDLPFGKGPTP